MLRAVHGAHATLAEQARDAVLPHRDTLHGAIVAHVSWADIRERGSADSRIRGLHSTIRGNLTSACSEVGAEAETMRG